MTKSNKIVWGPAIDVKVARALAQYKKEIGK